MTLPVTLLKAFRSGFVGLALLGLALAAVPASALTLKSSGTRAADFPVVVKKQAAPIVVDAGETEVVHIAAKMLAEDIGRVSGTSPGVLAKAPTEAASLIVAGTLGHSPLIDGLAVAGKLKELPSIRGRWEATLWQIVDQPFPGVDRALVIVGSDRRGTAYGLLRISETIGVSPWSWWADVPAVRRESLVLNLAKPETDAPAVPYRGIFINDEDWGLHEWAKRTYEPSFGGIGPKTYEKVCELMLRLRLNYLWPAMHEISREFHSVPENIAVLARYGIVAGASHCEPMLFNNANWKESELGRWDYTLNRDTIHSVWEEQARTRGDKEAVWGIGIRGIHDRGMQGPRDVSKRITILEDVFRDQRALLDKHVTKEWGPVSQVFVPYKEVLTLYDAGLSVPDDVAIVWVDDNFGYIRRLGKPEERKRPGGAGVYWHLSYYGGPHSYLWINSTAPALMWEQLHKAWENDARRIWVLNVGDIKPMEIGMDYFARFAWSADTFGPDSQPKFLREFAARQFGEKQAKPIANLLGEFYRLGTVRKPELMTRAWALSLTDKEAALLRKEYDKLLKATEKIETALPREFRDAYFEIVGFPAKVLGATGLLFLADRDAQFGADAAKSANEIGQRRDFLEKQVARFNDEVADGKWRHMMPGLVTARNLTAWNSQVRWPWGEPKDAVTPDKPVEDSGHVWRDAASADRFVAAGSARWTPVEGLGHTGRAVALKPAGLGSSWKEDDASAPSLTFKFSTKGGEQDALIDFLPAFRLFPGMLLRVAVSVDGRAPVLVEVPGSSGKDDENGPTRREGIQNNYVRARVSLGDLSSGRHTLRISAVDPGAVIDRVALPVK